jgi:hypothetical protein
MGDLSIIFLLFRAKIKFKNHLIKSNCRVLWKNEVDNYGAPVFAPDYSTFVLAFKMFSNSNEHSMYIRFLWSFYKSTTNCKAALTRATKRTYFAASCDFEIKF